MAVEDLIATCLVVATSQPVTEYNMLIPHAKVLFDAAACEVYADHCEVSGHLGLARAWREFARGEIAFLSTALARCQRDA